MCLHNFIATKTIPMKPVSIPFIVQQFKILSRYLAHATSLDPQRAISELEDTAKIAVKANDFLPKTTAPKLRAMKTDITRPIIEPAN